jgi:hypothetical protein
MSRYAKWSIRGVVLMASVKITRVDFDAAQLRAEASRTADAKQARRILAIAMVLMTGVGAKAQLTGQFWWIWSGGRFSMC